MFLVKQQIINQLYHKLLAVICGCMLWYIVAEKMIITQTRQVPIFVHNTDNVTDSFLCPSTASITIAFSPLLLLTLRDNEMSVHIDAHGLPKHSAILTEYAHAVHLPKGIKIVHCNPIIMHKVEKNIVV